MPRSCDSDATRFGPGRSFLEFEVWSFCASHFHISKFLAITKIHCLTRLEAEVVDFEDDIGGSCVTSLTLGFLTPRIFFPTNSTEKLVNFPHLGAHRTGRGFLSLPIKG